MFSNSLAFSSFTIPKEELILSYSSIDDYALCPFKYYLKYVLKLDQFEESFSQKLGTLYHAVLASSYKDNFDFEITCPYCNYEFFVDIDENKTEIECPECKNTIELDWSGDIEDEPKENKTKNSNFQGGCPGCHGCGSFNIKKDEDDDM